MLLESEYKRSFFSIGDPKIHPISKIELALQSLIQKSNQLCRLQELNFVKPLLSREKKI
jgi:hypothetical protein